MKDDFYFEFRLNLNDNRIIRFKLNFNTEENEMKKISSKIFLLLDEIDGFPNKMFENCNKLKLITKSKRKKLDKEFITYKEFDKIEISRRFDDLEVAEEELLKEKLLLRNHKRRNEQVEENANKRQRKNNE